MLTKNCEENPMEEIPAEILSPLPKTSTPASPPPQNSSEEDGAVKYFQNNFNLQLNSKSGIIEDDQNLRNLLSMFYKVFQGDLTHEALLETRKNDTAPISADTEKTLVSSEESKTELPARQYLDPSMIENVPTILSQILSDHSAIGPEVLKLLNYIGCLANQPIHASICFHIFYATPISSHNMTIAGNSILSEDEDGLAENVDPKQICVSNLKEMLKILEEYQLLCKADISKDEDEYSLEREDPNWFVKLNPIVYKYLRYTGRTFDEGRKWSSSLLSLADLLVTCRRPEYEPHVISIHKGLEALSWPEKSFVYSLHFASALTTWFNSHEQAQHLLSSVYTLLAGKAKPRTEEEDDREVTEEEEYLVMSKLALIHLENVRREEESLLEGKLAEDKAYDEEILDYSLIFKEEDELKRINRETLFDWTLERVTEYPGNELIQHFGAQLLMVPLVVHEHCLDDVRHAQVINWIRGYCRLYGKTGDEQRLKCGLSLLETPLTMMKIAMQVLPGIQVIEMAVNMTKAVEGDCGPEGQDERSWFLQEVLYLTKPSLICVWEQEDLSDAKQFEMREICQVYIEQGQAFFIAMLTQLGKTFSRDSYLDLHFLDFLETMKASAFFDECVTILLNSTELLHNLRRIFNKILDSIEMGDNPGNIKAVCQIIVFWATLLCDFERIHNGTPALFRLVEDMDNFHEKLNQEESRVAKAFVAEKHWHSYFREQGETSERILDYFLERDDGSLKELSHIYKLAEKLRETMRKDWWMASVNFITTASRVFRSGEKRQFKNVQDVHGDSENHSSCQSDVDEDYTSDHWELKLCTQIPKPHLNP